MLGEENGEQPYLTLPRAPRRPGLGSQATSPAYTQPNWVKLKEGPGVVVRFSSGGGLLLGFIEYFGPPFIVDITGG